jgi:hypothetical protein
MSHLREVAHLVSLKLRTIRKQHQAGINPTTGELFDLFDLGDRLETEADISEPTVPCSIAECKRASSAVVQSRPYCDRCAEALRAVTSQIAQDAPELARQRIEAMVAGRASWPANAPMHLMRPAVAEPTSTMPAAVSTPPLVYR